MTTDIAPLGIGIVGSGFIANFHVESWRGVRGADIVAIASRNRSTANALADKARALGVGDPTVASEVGELLRNPAVHAIWVLVPNFLRASVVETICEEVAAGRGELPASRSRSPSRHRSRQRGRSPTPSPVRGSSVATSRIRCSLQASAVATRSYGRAARRRPAHRTWRDAPKSTRDRTARGSGTGANKAAACSAT